MQADHISRVVFEYAGRIGAAHDTHDFLKLNADMAKSWPNITVSREPPADAKEFDGKPDKFEKYFSAEPGEGD